MFSGCLKIASLYAIDDKTDKPAQDGTCQKPLNEQVLRRRGFAFLKNPFRLVSPTLSIYGRFSSSKNTRIRVNLNRKPFNYSCSTLTCERQCV